jgi:hypothetical protein
MNAAQIMAMARVAPLPLANPEVPLYGNNPLGEEQLQRLTAKQLTAKKVPKPSEPLKEQKYVEVMNTGASITQSVDRTQKQQGFSLVKTAPVARIKTGPATNVPKFLEALEKRQMNVQNIKKETEKNITQVMPIFKRVNAVVEVPKPVEQLPPVPETMPSRSRNKVTASMMVDKPAYNTVLGDNVPIKREGQYISKKTGLFTVEKRGAPTKD